MSEPFVGEIRIFAGNYAPRNWAFCQGQLMSIGEFDALFSLLGNIYGGDGRTTFGLPDLRGRVPVHQGTGPGLTPRIAGNLYGNEEVTLQVEQLPRHSHAIQAAGAADSATPQGNLPGDGSVSSSKAYSPSAQTPATMAADMLEVSGDGLPHNNIMPSLAVNYIISLMGIYPTRN